MIRRSSFTHTAPCNNPLLTAVTSAEPTADQETTQNPLCVSRNTLAEPYNKSLLYRIHCITNTCIIKKVYMYKICLLFVATLRVRDSIVSVGPTLVSFSIVLTSSSKDRFFLSTTSFCCGVLGAENLCLIPSLLQNLSNFSF